MNKKEMIRKLQDIYRNNPALTQAEKDVILEVLGFLGGEEATYFMP